MKFTSRCCSPGRDESLQPPSVRPSARPVTNLLPPAGSEAPGVSEERELSSEASGSPVVFNPHTSLSIEKQRQKLPVFKVSAPAPPGFPAGGEGNISSASLLRLLLQHRNNILYLVESYQTVIIVGETGCGKSTQIPQVGPAPAASPLLILLQLLFTPSSPPPPSS